MPGVANFWVNLAGFQACWWACALWGNRGALFALILLLMHMALHPRRDRALSVIAAGAGLGLLIDSLQVAAGWLAFPGSQYGLPFWLFVLWGCFAATLNHSLHFLQERPLLASLFGAIGGPASYYAGSAFGRLAFPDPMAGLMMMALVWACLLPGLLMLAHTLYENATRNQEVTDET